MARYIDADGLIAKIKPPQCEDENSFVWLGDVRKILRNFVNEAPTAEVEEVRHGEWVTVYSENGYHKECSVCGSRWMLDSKEHVCKETKRCYECGAKMGGRK